MANERIDVLEDGILALLDPLKIQNGGYLKTLKTYAGDFQQAREQIVVVAPAVLLTYAGAEHVVDEQTERQRWTLIVADSALRTEEAGRRGGVAGTGITGVYKILRDVRDRLDKKRPVADAAPLLWLREDVLVLDPTWSIYVAHYGDDLTYVP